MSEEFIEYKGYAIKPTKQLISNYGFVVLINGIYRYFRAIQSAYDYIDSL